MKRTICKIMGRHFIVAKIRLEDGGLSVSGSYGSILSEQEAKREAFRYWRNFFKDDPREIADMRQRCPEFCGWSPTAAARYVLRVDGALYGIDVHDTMPDGRVMVTEGCGQCWEELLEAWPEMAPLQKWHLNYMRAECEHQEERGETWKTHPSAVCPDCGYVLGSEWKKRVLPAEIAALAEKVGNTDSN